MISDLASPAWTALADRVIAGDGLSRDEALAMLAAPDEELLEQLTAAYRVRRRHFGNRVRLHFLLNAQSGLCPEDCYYCSQSRVSAADIERYPMLALDRILEAAERAASIKAATFCLVISGRAPGDRVFEKVLDAIRTVRARYDLRICACLGLLTQEQACRLKEVGATQVNHNLNTSRRHYPAICTSHTYDDRRETVRRVGDAGLRMCSGGIVGMGETDEDVVDLALELRQLGVQSVPVNFLIPIPGTPLARVRALNPRRCLRVLCAYRFLLPDREIRIAGGREVHLRSMQVLGLYAANSIFIGDYLTTGGQAAHADLSMIRDAGFVVEAPDGLAIDGDPLEGVPEIEPRCSLPMYPVTP